MAIALAVRVDVAAATPWLTVTGATGPITVQAFPEGGPAYTVRASFANGREQQDPDAPLEVAIEYVASDAGSAQAVRTVTIDSDTDWLSVMDTPTRTAPVLALTDRDQTWIGRSVPHDILGTPAPLVTVQSFAYRQGTFELLARTVDDWAAIRDILEPGAVLLLRSRCQTEIADTAFIALGVSVDLPWNAPAQRPRIVSLDYQATRRDQAVPRAIAWTYADVPASFATYNAVRTGLPTYLALLEFLPAGAAAARVPA